MRIGEWELAVGEEAEYSLESESGELRDTASEETTESILENSSSSSECPISDSSSAFGENWWDKKILFCSGQQKYFSPLRMIGRLKLLVSNVIQIHTIIIHLKYTTQIL